MTEIYKTLHGLNPPYMQSIFSLKQSNYNLRNSDVLLNVPRPSTSKFGKHCLSYQGPVLWNKLPGEIRSAESLSKFRSQICKYNWPIGDLCNCDICNS